MCGLHAAHDKCFAPIVLASNPALVAWICRRCGVEGRDVGPRTRPFEYQELQDRFRLKNAMFSKHGWAVFLPKP